MYLSLYRKWRPRTFDEMCGQEHITDILRKQCASEHVSHAYLFCGSRGTGKTSAAKILAKAVNCEHPINGNPCNECASCRSINNGSATDVLEIDAASNNGVNNIRDLREEVVYPPTVLKKRVYIIDEVHMLSDSAFNALLKTLEEPPEYVIFIFATTELNEIPATVISRCIRFDFSRIDISAVLKRISFVASQENIQCDESALELIARLADGSLRDALSLLESCSNGSSGTLTEDAVRSILGLAGDDTVCELLNSAAKGDVAEAMETIDALHRSSKDISAFLDDLSFAVRDLLIEKQLLRANRAGRLNGKKLGSLTNEFTGEQLFNISAILEETQNRLAKYTVNKRTILELAVIRLCDESLSDSPRALAARISTLEKKLAAMTASGYSPERKDTKTSEVVSSDSNNEIADTSAVSEKQKPEVSAEEPFLLVPELAASLNTSPETAAFIKQVNISSSGDTLFIRGGFIEMQMIEADSELLSEAVASITGKRYKIVFETTEKEEEMQQSLIDEL